MKMLSQFFQDHISHALLGGAVSLGLLLGPSLFPRMTGFSSSTVQEEARWEVRQNEYIERTLMKKPPHPNRDRVLREVQRTLAEARKRAETGVDSRYFQALRED